MNEKKIPQMWSQIRCAVLLIGMNLVWIVPLGKQFYQVYVAGWI